MAPQKKQYKSQQPGFKKAQKRKAAAHRAKMQAQRAQKAKEQKKHASGMSVAQWEERTKPKQMISTPGVTGQKYKAGARGQVLDEKGRRIGKQERGRLGRSLGYKRVVDPETGAVNMVPDVASAQVRRTEDQSMRGARRIVEPPQPRKKPTVATPDKPVITKGELPQVPMDLEQQLEDIAVKRATGQQLSDEDLRAEFQAARQATMQQPAAQAPQLPQDPYMPAEFAQLTAEQVSMLPPADQARYQQHAQQAQLLRERDFRQQMEGETDQIYDERIAGAEQELEQQEEQIQEQHDELLNDFKQLREEMDADAIEEVKEAGVEGIAEIKQLMARRGALRSSATADKLQKASKATQKRVAEIERATGTAIKEFEVQLLDRLDEKVAKYETRVEKYKDQKDTAKMEQAKQDVELATKIFSADPNNPQKVAELAQTLQQQKIADKEALQASAVNKFEKALEHGYVPTGMSEAEQMILADNLGVAPQDLAPTVTSMIERSQRKEQIEDVHYTTDPWGNTTAVIPNLDTGKFDTIRVAEGPFAGLQSESPLNQGSPSSNYQQPNYIRYAGADQEDLERIFNIGGTGGWCGVRASEISTAPKVGNSWAEKQQKISHYNSPTPGDKMLIPMGVKTDGQGNYPGTGANEYGHVGVVLDYDPSTGDIVTVESNADGAINKCLAGGEGQQACLAKGKNSIQHRNLNELNQMYGTGTWGFAAGDFTSDIKSQLDQVAPPQEATTSEVLPETYGKSYQDYMVEGTNMGMLPEAAQDYAKEKMKWDQEAPDRLFDKAHTLAGEFKPLQKKVRVLEEGMAVAKDFDINTKNPYADDALIFSFVKTMDPGSVVREGEYEVRKNATSMYNSVTARFDLAVKGEGMLKPQQRQQLIDQMREMYTSKRSSLDLELDAARNKGLTFGIDPSLYLTVPDAAEFEMETEGEDTITEEEAQAGGGVIVYDAQGNAYYYEDPNDPEITEGIAAGYYINN